MAALPPLMRKEYVDERYWSIVPIIHLFLKYEFLPKDEDYVEIIQNLKMIYII